LFDLIARYNLYNFMGSELSPEKRAHLDKIRKLEEEKDRFDLYIDIASRVGGREGKIASFYKRIEELIEELRPMYLSDLYDPFEGKR
jgi:methylaspartate ammonia-lyase